MGDPFREVYRLEQLELCFDGLESFSIDSRMKDFVGYYFSRFITNVKHRFQDFSQSELEQFNKRYERQISLTLKDPLLVIDDIRVAIPKGMLLSYYQTLEKLLMCLAHIQADRLTNDLKQLSLNVYTGSDEALPKSIYTKKTFESDKKTIGSLYNPTSLSYSLGKAALVSLPETIEVNDILLSLTRDYYPQVISMAKLIDELETAHDKTYANVKQTSLMREKLMETAYRVSVFAVVMDHIQAMEHAFVTALTTLKNTSNRI